MTQLATQAIGAPFSRPLNVADMHYAYEVDQKTGFCAPTIAIVDLETNFPVPWKDMGETAVCPVATGACVSSATGGVIEGWDMYGQHIAETVAALGTSTIAFAGITLAPDDALWANQFGLPYAYSAAAAAPNTDVTIVPPAADEDSRGTFTWAGTFNTDDPLVYDEVEVPYIADRSALFGAPYATRYATADPKSVAETTMAGTIDSAGAVAITTTQVADGSSKLFFTMPDGGVLEAANGAGTANYTLSPLWMSKYAKDIDDVDLLIKGSTSHGSSIVVDLTGSVTLAAPISNPIPGGAKGISFTVFDISATALQIDFADASVATADGVIEVSGIEFEGLQFAPIPVPFAAGDTAQQIAAKVAAAIDAEMDLTGAETLHAHSGPGATVVITGTGGGTNAHNGVIPTLGIT